MIGQTRSMIFPIGGAAPNSASTSLKDHNETIYDFLLRMKDELLWPRILVRIAPPLDEI